MAKRLFDVVLSGLAVLLLSPLLLLVVLLVKLDTPGPAIYRQERVGRGGRVFRIRKFRTMIHALADPGLQITVAADPRVTRTGRWLRRTKIDELAQLFDVLEGKMSLVGPRPEVPRYVALYAPGVRDKVLSVRPGITDLASIEFSNEDELLARAADPEQEYVKVVLPRKLRLACEYVDKASFWTDLRLLTGTLRLLILGRR